MINKTVALPLLKGIWKFSLLLFFPALLWGYLKVSGTQFSQLDSGINGHKASITLLYIGFTLVWLTVNRKLEKRFKQN